MSKHTPGPWQAEPMTGRGAWVKGENGTWAALSCGDTDLEAEANARLIAAAPDMLDALRPARIQLAYAWSVAKARGEHARADIINKAIKDIDAAIAKAEGRS